MAVFNSGGAVGLAIGPGSVRAVAVDRVRGEVGVTCYAETRIGTPREDEEYREILVGAVRELFQANSLPRDRVVAVLNSSEAVLRRAALPFEDESRIRKTIRFEVEDALPFPIEDCVADYHVGHASEGKTEVLVAAVAKERVRDMLSVLEECGLETIALELDLGAMVNVAAWAGQQDRCVLLLDVGQDVTRAVVYEGRAVFWRGFRTETGSVADVAKKLAAEVRRSLLSGNLERDPEVLYLSGSHPGLPQLAEALGEVMDIEVSSLEEPGDRMADGVAWEDVRSGGLIALGCALKYSGYDISTINLRQDEFVYRRKFEQLTSALTVLASFVLACGVLWNLRIAGALSFVSGEQSAIHANAVELWRDAGIEEAPPETVEGMFRRAGDLLAFMKPDKNAKDVSVRSILDEWREWAGRIPAGMDIQLEEIGMQQTTVQLIGTAPDVADAEKLQEALNGGGRFSFDLPQTRKTSEGRTRFTLRHEYK